MPNSIEGIPQAAIDSVKKYSDELIKGAESAIKLIDASDKLNDLLDKLGKTEEDNKTTRKKLTEAEKESLRIKNQQLKTVEKIKQAESSAAVELVKSKIKLQELNRTVKESIKLDGAQENSKVKLLAENKKLRKEIEKLDLTLDENKLTIEAYNATIDKNTELINDNSDANLKAKNNVGNYEESIKSALEGSNAFSGGITDVISNFIGISQQEGGVKGFFNTFVGGMRSAIKAGLAFIATPIGAIIAAIVVGVGIFTAAINRNQESADGFAKVWAGVSNVIDELIGLWFKLIGVWVKFITLDFKGGISELEDAFDGLSGSMSQAFKEGKQLLDLQIQLEKINIKNATAIAELNKIAREQGIIADDNTRSFKVREDAADKARKASEESLTKQLEGDKKLVEIANIKVTQASRQGTITRVLLQEQADAQANLINAESELTAVIRENEKTRAELKQDRLERDLDILIDGFDNQKTINEKLIADDTKTENFRRSLLLETRELAEASFNRQIETIKQFTDVSIDSSNLIAESDAIALNSKIRALGLSEIIEGRLLEIIRDRKSAIQDLNETEQDLSKSTLLKESKSIDVLNNLFKDNVSEREEFENQITKSVELNAERRISAAKREADERKALNKAIKEAAINLGQETIDALFQIGDDQRDAELEKVQAQREEDVEAITIKQEEDIARIDEQLAREAISEEDAALQKKAINDKATLEKEKADQEAAKKEREIKIKQAKSDKISALIGIQINTALAISKTAATVGFPAAIPLIVLAAALGAVQTATVLAQPIPKFFKGTKSAPAGKLIAGERGTELIKPVHGDPFLTPQTATLYSGLEGAEIIPHRETMQIINQSGGTATDMSGVRTDLKKILKATLNNNNSGEHKTAHRTIKNAFIERYNLN